METHMNTPYALHVAEAMRGSDNPEYRKAIGYLISHREEIPHRVFVLLPGGLRSNANPAWDAVKAGTESRCGCGNDRVLLPANIREEYRTGSAVVLALGSVLHIRPRGGNKESCALRAELGRLADDEKVYGLRLVVDPFGPLNMRAFLDVLAPSAYSLVELVNLLPQGLFLNKSEGSVKVPILQVTAIDLLAPSVTLLLDQDMDLFDLATGGGHTH